MGFDLLWSYANKKSTLRLDGTHTDSLVNDQILREESKGCNETRTMVTLHKFDPLGLKL